jgi:nicotinate-nucleotide adenylyltransferase
MTAAAIGVFGGTFNPIHLGHLRVAEEVCEALALERMLFVPSADPPLKRTGGEALAPASLRLAWTRRAVEGNARFAVDAIELERAGPSFSVDTLRILGERLGAKPVFVLGRDAFVELPLWREPERLLTLAHFAVMTRPPDDREPLSAWLAPELTKAFTWSADGEHARHRAAGTWLRRVAVTPLAISSTDVRRRLRAGRSVRYLLPEAIHDAVVSSGIYGSEMSTSEAPAGAKPG